MISKSNIWFKSYGNFTEWVDFVDWWSFIGKACLSNKLSNKLFNVQTPSLILEWDEPGSDISQNLSHTI